MTKKKMEVAYEKRKERIDIAYGIYYVDGVDHRLRKVAWK